MYQCCTFVGKLIKDPELKITKNNKDCAYLMMSVGQAKKNSDGTYDNSGQTLVTVILWGKSAEVVCKFSKKGDHIMIPDAKYSSFKKEDGTYGHSFSAFNFVFIPKEKTNYEADGCGPVSSATSLLDM